MSLSLRLFLLIVAIAFAVSAVGYRYVMLKVREPLPLENPVVLEVAKGDSIYHVARELKQRGLLEGVRLFAYYARYMDMATRIKAGEYQLQPGVSLHQLLEQLVEGDVIQYSVTLVEGHTTREYLARLAAEDKLIRSDELAEMLSDPGLLMAALGKPDVHPEGQFFPDTYFFVKGATALDILERAHERMVSVLQEEWENKGKDLPYESPYEALIMASIIEKETGVESERPDIAGVFVRRLQKRMRLQTDPTVIYGLGDAYQGNITRRHLKQKTPYNTYVIAGLPPTPIANPGREAIHAALHPAEGKTLYFVARGDGSHVFSETLEEHNRAVRQYQLKRRSDYRSAPAP
ncbi:MAG: endolytic transglycosylase MltG [Ketobacteraceae bacterium]|nr:endolytic transglycosylase MltG [Ketobacteraceae bacterium]